MRLRTLGELSLEGGIFKGAKPLMLLAYLAVEGAQDRWLLKELFWREAKDPKSSLSTALGQLRRAGPGLVGADEARAWIEARCDAKELLEALERSENEKALELYRGPFLAGVDPSAAGVELEEWIYATRESLGSRVRLALLDLAEEHASAGEFGSGAELSQRSYLLPGAPEPLPEELERMYVLLRAGDHKEAFEILKEAAGYDLELSLSVEEARSALQKGGGSTENEMRHNLPVQSTRFVGRRAEKAKIGTQLADPDCRLLTVTGPGGIGKTRLAIEVATSQLGSFPDGVFFVTLARITSTTSMPIEITSALGVKLTGEQDASEQLLNYLESKQLLLVLDNLEHLIKGADLIQNIWERAPGVKLLVTSRVRLNLRAERVFILTGMTSPDEIAVEESDAVQLFLQSAGSGGHELILSESTTPEVVRVCRLVGGMPLALELAAGWLHALTLSEIAVEITRGIDVLQAFARDIPNRHRSIRAVFESSWELLPESEQGVLRRLSVFRGGFKRDTASVVAGASLLSLGDLVDRSLLSLSSGGRYEQHPLFLEYARERLAAQPEEHEEAAKKHGLYYLSFLRERSRASGSSEYMEVQTLLENELPNIVAAWEWAIDQNRHDTLKESAYDFCRLHQYRRQEGFELFAWAHATLDPENPEHRTAWGYTLLGQVALSNWVTPEEDSLEQALELLRPLGEPLGIAWALSILAPRTAWYDRDLEQALEHFQTGLALARRAGNSHLVARIMLDRDYLYRILGHTFEEGKKSYRETERELRELGLPDLQIQHLASFGLYLIDQGHFEEGKAKLEQSLELADEYLLDGYVPGAKNALALVALQAGDLEDAQALLLEHLAELRTYGGLTDRAETLKLLGKVATEMERFAEAEGYLFEALRLVSPAEKVLFANLAIVQFLGELRIAEGELVAGAEWLSFVVHRAAHGSRAGAECRRSLERLRDRVLPEELRAAVSRGEQMTLDDIRNKLPPTF